MPLIFLFLLILGIAQLLSTGWHLRALSLVGPNRLMGFGLALLLIAFGVIGLQGALVGWSVIGWLILIIPLVVVILVLTGSFIWPPPHPNTLFTPDHSAHSSLTALQIPDGDSTIPALLLRPPVDQQTGAAVCLAHGSGDHKTSFKWRLIRALLAEGLTVLTIDLPGHGEYASYPLSLPESLSTIPTALRFLRAQPGVERVGVLGISLGAALALKSIVTAQENGLVDAVALLEMPLWLKYDQALVRREMACMLTAPVLDLFQEISVKQLRQSWGTPVVRSRHSTEETFALLEPRQTIGQLDPSLPLLLVYSRRDPIAPATFGQELKAAAPQATLIEDRRASHVTMTLMPGINRQVARWLRQALLPEAGSEPR